AGPPHGVAGCFVLVTRRAEGQVMKALPRPPIEEHRLALERRRAQAHGVTAARRVHQAEARVELLPRALIGHLERVVQQRFDRHRGFLPGRPLLLARTLPRPRPVYLSDSRLVEERHGFPGALRAWGGMSGPPTSTDATRAWLRPLTVRAGL